MPKLKALNLSMAYDKGKIYKQAAEAISANNLFFIEETVSLLPCSKSTFYEYFPVESDEMNALKELLEVNKVATKAKIRAKLFESNRASELLPLYRLIATQEERRCLNQSYIDHTTNEQPVNIAPIEWVN
tara:strand:- start:9041 stop:9430 length:390 start_codon:yes stop_codon:yes gene_type:complete